MKRARAKNSFENENRTNQTPITTARAGLATSAFAAESASDHLITINVLDLRERPRFVNTPSPFQAVVPTSPPVGMRVYTFRALNEDGDGDSNVAYKLINS